MTDSEVKEIAGALAKLEPGYLPEDIFYAISRLSVQTAAEVVPLRRSDDGSYEVLLTPRPENDPFFAGLVHVPGQIYRPGDALESRPKMVVVDELPNTAVDTEPQLIRETYIYDYGRGPVVERIHYIFVSSSSDGEFYPVDALPDNILPGHARLINLVIKHIEEQV